MTLPKQLGAKAEQLALNYLTQQGLILVTANYYSRFGEIDLIMHDSQDGYIFVEVKQRMAGLSSAIESITPAKQRKLLKTAKYFLFKLGKDVNCRFDAVVLDGTGQLEWLKNIITI